MAWSNNIGASVPEVVDAAFAQARELSHLRSNFDSVPLLLLSKAMTEAAPGDLKRIGFTLHGSLAVEMAMKLALINRPQQHRPVAGARRRLPRPVAGQHGPGLAAHQPRVRPGIPRGAAGAAAVCLPVGAHR